MPLALAPYLEPYGAYLRPAGYYATWSAYYLSYVISPGLVTVLQALILLLSWLLPTIEAGIERARRNLLASRSAREGWAWPDRVPGQKMELPVWAQTAFAYIDVRWLFAIGWLACVERLRALSRKMGWEGKVAAPVVVTDRIDGLQPLAILPFAAPTPSQAPSVRSNPFSTAPPIGASVHASTVGGSTYRRRHSAQQVPHVPPAHSAISTWRQETASAFGSIHSRRSNPFSAAGHGASSIPIRAPSARSASHHGGAQPYSPLRGPTQQDGEASIWSGSGGWKAA